MIITQITVSLATLSDQALDGLTYHPEARVQLAARQEQDRRAACRSPGAGSAGGTMTDLTHPTITMLGGYAFRVLGVDAGKAPAFAAAFDAATTPEGIVKVVDECIELGVPLWVESVGTNNSKHWVSIRNHAVASVNCVPFD